VQMQYVFYVPASRSTW